MDRLGEESVLRGTLEREVRSHVADLGTLREQAPGRQRDERDGGEGDCCTAHNHFVPETFLISVPSSTYESATIGLNGFAVHAILPSGPTMYSRRFSTGRP